MAGYRGLLAPWIGGASSAPAAADAGFKGLLAPWIGGVASAPDAADAGFKGLLAPWIGGAASPSADNPGYRGLLAFWAGGACNAGSTPPDPEPPIYVGIPMPRRHTFRRGFRIEQLDDELLLASTVLDGRMLH